MMQLHWKFQVAVAGEALFFHANDPVEVPYYSSEKFSKVCTNCACGCSEGKGRTYYVQTAGTVPVLKTKRVQKKS
jgi:hypothetical protein